MQRSGVSGVLHHEPLAMREAACLEGGREHHVHWLLLLVCTRSLLNRYVSELRGMQHEADSCCKHTAAFVDNTQNSL